MSFPGIRRSSCSLPADPSPLSRRYGAALRTVVAVSEARLGGGKLRQLRPGEREADPHAHGLRRGSGELDTGAVGERVGGGKRLIRRRLLIAGWKSLLAVRQKLQQREAVAAAHHLGEAQGPRLQLRGRPQLLAVPLSHRRLPSMREVSRDAGARRVGGAAH